MGVIHFNPERLAFAGQRFAPTCCGLLVFFSDATQTRLSEVTCGNCRRTRRFQEREQ